MEERGRHAARAHLADSILHVVEHFVERKHSMSTNMPIARGDDDRLELLGEPASMGYTYS